MTGRRRMITMPSTEEMLKRLSHAPDRDILMLVAHKFLFSASLEMTAEEVWELFESAATDLERIGMLPVVLISLESWVRALFPDDEEAVQAILLWD